jgi:CDP-glucose 4,6-dehydratase
VRFLISGHTGFKGSWLAAILAAQGHEIVGISLAPTAKSLYNEAKLGDIFSEEHFLDIRNRNVLTSAIRKSKADVAIHLAAQPLVRDSYVYPIETFETNVTGTLNFLEGIKNSDVMKCLVITTDKVYKNQKLLRGYLETDPLGGHDPYSASKACADLATQSWISSFNLNNVSIARAGNVIGGGDWAKDRLLPDLVRAFSTGVPAKIRYPNAIRPWQHVADCLSGYLKLIEAMTSDDICGEWNFGPSINVENSVRRVVEVAAAKWGTEANWKFDTEENVHEAEYLLLDSSKARDQLKWDDKLTFHESVEWTIDFYKRAFRGENARSILEQQVSKYLDLSVVS